MLKRRARSWRLYLCLEVSITQAQLCQNLKNNKVTMAFYRVPKSYQSFSVSKMVQVLSLSLTQYGVCKVEFVSLTCHF